MIFDVQFQKGHFISLKMTLVIVSLTSVQNSMETDTRKHSEKIAQMTVLVLQYCYKVDYKEGYEPQ